MFSALDWLPTFVEIGGGPKGDGLKKEMRPRPARLSVIPKRSG
jgi:hypothetical protein